MKSTKELFEMIKKYLERNFYFSHTMVGEQKASIIAESVMLTWIYDQFDFCPYLMIIGERGTGKTVLGHILSKVVYQFVQSGNATATINYLLKQTSENPGTIIFDGGVFGGWDDSIDVVRFLTFGARKDQPLFRSMMVKKGHSKKTFEPLMFSTYCPKIILACPEELNMIDANSIVRRSIQIELKNVSLDELVANGIRIEINQNKLDAESDEITNGLKEWREAKIADHADLERMFVENQQSHQLNPKFALHLALAYEIHSAPLVALLMEYGALR